MCVCVCWPLVFQALTVRFSVSGLGFRMMLKMKSCNSCDGVDE